MVKNKIRRKELKPNLTFLNSKESNSLPAVEESMPRVQVLLNVYFGSCFFCFVHSALKSNT